MSNRRQKEIDADFDEYDEFEEYEEENNGEQLDSETKGTPTLLCVFDD
jgi:hypothetical protein